MAINDIFNFFLVFSALHGFLFCLMLLFSKTGKKKSICFINVLVLSISLNNLQSWFLAKGIFNDYIVFNYAEIPWHFLIAPFFYMFLIHYLEIEKKYLNVLKVILPVFFLFVIVRLYILYLDGGNIIEGVSPFFQKYAIIEEAISIAFSMSIFGYSYRIFKLSKKEKINTNVIYFDNLNWVRNFFNLGVIVYVTWLVPLSLTLGSNFEIFIYSYYPLRVFTTVLIYWLGYQSIIKLRLLNERKYLREQFSTSFSTSGVKEKLKDGVPVNKVDSEISISKEIVDSVLSGLVSFEEKREYTSQKITLNTLAKKLNTNSSYLSKIINYHKEGSFSNYLNRLRIDNIIEQLKSHSKIRKFTIKAIAQEAGYSNSDSFSKAFFKLKGIRPSDFIKQLEEEDIIVERTEKESL